VFFDDYPRFLETSDVAAQKSRLNLRHEGIFGENADILAGRSVLDIASHDGRWTYAALRAGASHVVGVEARPDLVAQAETTLDLYGADPASYEFHTADVFDFLGEPRSFDVVLCLGFLYHTLRFGELLSGIRDTGAQYVVVDTRSHPVDDDVIRIVVDRVEKQGHAVQDPWGHGGAVLTGTPSPSALARMFAVYGYHVCHKVDWAELLGDSQVGTIAAYRENRRVTWTFQRR
jgi:protein-L-isoaspartate O-methyltransferase